jgi:transposase
MTEMTTTSTIGLDLGDRKSHLCFLDGEGNVEKKGRCASTRRGFRKIFEGRQRTKVVLEVGTHSPWVSALLETLNHEVIVANPRKVQLIAASQSKNDISDPELLARLGRVDPKLLCPVKHRGAEAQKDLVVIRSRFALMGARTKLVNHSRCIVKSAGERLPSCTTDAFAKKVESEIPVELRPALGPVLKIISEMTVSIKQMERTIEREFPTRYPDIDLLTQVCGVGPLTAATFILTLDDPQRFDRSRKVGAYLGLRPARRQSGNKDPELRITKAGDHYLRSLLVNCAQYILGPFGKDSDLRRWGLQLASRGKKSAKKRAVVATARKLAVLLHRLWTTGEVYQAVGYGRKSDPVIS